MDFQYSIDDQKFNEKYVEVKELISNVLPGYIEGFIERTGKIPFDGEIFQNVVDQLAA